MRNKIFSRCLIFGILFSFLMSITLCVTALDPNPPTCINPTDTQADVLLSTNLSVHVIDLDNDTMNVSFYWEDHTLIETINNTANNTNASTTISLGLTYNTLYSWYTIANDSTTSNTSDTFNFTTLTNVTPNKRL